MTRMWGKRIALLGMVSCALAACASQPSMTDSVASVTASPAWSQKVSGTGSETSTVTVPSHTAILVVSPTCSGSGDLSVKLTGGLALTQPCSSGSDVVSNGVTNAARLTPSDTDTRFTVTVTADPGTSWSLAFSAGS